MNEIREKAPRCLSVVMPVYNEEATIAEMVGRVLAQPVVQELIVVDDCSTDGTWAALQKVAEGNERIRLFRHEKNQGKGAGLRTGFKQARADIVIVQDADMEYDPAEYGKLLTPILNGRADVVFGS